LLGAIVGDIVGSRYEFNNIRTKEFPLLSKYSFFTDDTVMTLAVAKSLMKYNGIMSNLSFSTIQHMHAVGRRYPNCGYGNMFKMWLFSKNPLPYKSFGNGAATRVSACGIVGKTLDEVKYLAKEITEVSHNHVEGFKGAECVAVAVFLARQGKTKKQIYEQMIKYYKLNFTLNQIRDNHMFNESCQGTVPQALVAFFESTDFEDAIRNAVSIGGDSDTLAAITGSIAGEYYGIPTNVATRTKGYLDNYLKKILEDFELKYPPKIYDKNRIKEEPLYAK